MSEGGAALVWSPFASQEEAAAVARQLLEERLVACANILPHVLSIFRYDGKVQTAGEVGVLFKTEARLLDRATARLAELHPYATPAIAGWEAASAPPATREWLAQLVEEGG
ncbi:MAG: divalent-cation tolerance protein CutA [Erythrobacter sp.]|nr:divalent-cation tolerance protein CutA [Erythrobacter sp.]